MTWSALASNGYPDYAEIKDAVDADVLYWADDPGLDWDDELVINAAEYRSHIRWTGTPPTGNECMTKAQFVEFAWEPAPPAGVKPSLAQTQPDGGDVRASWTNTDEDHAIQVEWEINDVAHTPLANHSAGTQQSDYPEASLSQLDKVEARMRYYWEETYGAWSAWSDPLYYDE